MDGANMTSSPPNFTPETSSPLLAQLENQGFVLIRSLLTGPQLTALRGAASRLADRARKGDWPEVRTVGKQFPPWPGPEGPGKPRPEGIWGVQGLLERGRYEGSGQDEDWRVFARIYFSDALLGIVEELLECSGGDDDDDDGHSGPEERGGLVMELLNMLVAPPTPFALRWHRDDIPDTATVAEEEARLCCASPGSRGGRGRRQLQLHAQYNLALHADASLVVVPGSHRRARTDAERAADPFDAVPGREMPGAVPVRLAAGDCVFYDNNILHRGVYAGRDGPPDAGAGAGERFGERLTLHGSVGHIRAGTARARNVLQHGVGRWVGSCVFGEDVWLDQQQQQQQQQQKEPELGWPEGRTDHEKARLARRAEGMRARLVRLGQESGDYVGFSLEG